jgi:hypothetical protein
MYHGFEKGEVKSLFLEAAVLDDNPVVSIF